MKDWKTQLRDLLAEYTVIESRSAKGKMALAVTAVLVTAFGIFLLAVNIAMRPRHPLEPLPTPIPRAWPTDSIVDVDAYLYSTLIESALLDLHRKMIPPPPCLHAASFFAPAPNILLFRHVDDWHVVKNARVTPVGPLAPRRIASTTSNADFHIWSMAPAVRLEFSSAASVFTVRPIARLESPLDVSDEAVSACLQAIPGIRNQTQKRDE